MLLRGLPRQVALHAAVGAVGYDALVAQSILSRVTPTIAPIPMGAAKRASVALETGGWTGEGAAMVAEWDAETAFRWAYYANTFVYACIRANAEDAASLPFRAGASQDNPEDYDIRDPLAVLLGPPPGGPNPASSPEQLIGWSVIQYRVAGRFAWEVERNTRGEVVALWPLVAHRLRPIPSKGGTGYWDGFVYDTGRELRKLSVEQVIYVHRPSQTDWRQPESALQAARLDISVAVMQDRYDYAFLRNDARPAAIVVHEAFAESEDRDSWRAAFLDRFGGPDNAGKVHFAETDPNGSRANEAIAIHTLGLSQKDAEFIRRYEAKVRAITVGLGTPLSRIGDASAKTFANAHEELKAYWKHTMIGLLREMQNGINMQLAPMLGRSVGWFDLTTVEYLQPAKNYSDATLPLLVQAGIITRNEARAYLGEKPLPGGDELETVSPAAIEPGPGDDAGEAEDDVAAELEAGERSRTLVIPQVLAEERAIRSNLSAVDALEAKFQRTMGRLFVRQMEACLARMSGKRGRQATRADAPPGPDTIFDPVFWEEQTRQEAEELFESVFTVAGGQAAARFGISFDLEAPYARAFIGARSNQLAGQVTQTTYRAIQRQLAEGIAAGESIPSLADRIRSLFVQTYANRAETVARTEVISAYNGSTKLLGDQLGTDVVGGYEWLAALDERTRPEHAGAHGQIVRAGSGELFQVGGAMMAYPGDPAGGAKNSVNCRCTILSLTPDEMAEYTGRFAHQPLLDELDAAIGRVAS